MPPITARRSPIHCNSSTLKTLKKRLCSCKRGLLPGRPDCEEIAAEYTRCLLLYHCLKYEAVLEAEKGIAS